MAAICEIDDCGVSALGRCVYCERAFCHSHKHVGAGVQVTNGCNSCVKAEAKERLAAFGEALLRADVSERDRAVEAGSRLSEHLVIELHQSGLPMVPLTRLVEGRGLLGQRRLVEEPAGGEAWPIGQLEWVIGLSSKSSLTTRADRETGIAVNGDVTLLQISDSPARCEANRDQLEEAVRTFLEAKVSG